MSDSADDSFVLHDLRVEWIAGPSCYCGAKAGDHFELHGEHLKFPAGQSWSIYTLAALLPLLPAKQRPTHPNDWMTTDAIIACPDPNCSSRFGISRTGLRRFKHSEVTAVRLKGAEEENRGDQGKVQEQHSQVPLSNLGVQLPTTNYTISKLIKGGWHLAGGHGPVDRARAIEDMAAFVEGGITTFDCADIYTGVEELIGAFRRAYPELAEQVQVHTKFVPDHDKLSNLTAEYVEQIIDRSRARLGMDALDLVQFHWWDTEIPGYVEAAQELKRLQEAGKIRHIGLTNFNTARVKEIVEAGVPVISNQVQYSVLDHRPEKTMQEYCLNNGIALLCYGSLAGGFVAEAWLGQPEPAGPFENRSLTKYKLIIEDFGGWTLFQELLQTLQAVAQRHQANLSQIAVAWVLQQRAVGAAIVGATSTQHLWANLQIPRIGLSDDDLAAIAAVRNWRSGPEGDVFDLERDKTGRHGRIMKYNLNEGKE